MNSYLFEFFATLVFTYVILATKGNAYACGAIFAVLIILGSRCSSSGTLLNPAVTLAMLSAGKTAAKDVAPYIGAQIAGALTAVELLKRLKIGA
jgi:glycerol uptake facilitator-like aquaporin